MTKEECDDESSDSRTKYVISKPTYVKEIQKPFGTRVLILLKTHSTLIRNLESWL